MKYGRLGAGAFTRAAMVGRGAGEVDDVLYSGDTFDNA